MTAPRPRIVLAWPTLYNGPDAMRLVFMGTPTFVVPCLEALLQAGHELVAVFCPPDRAVGRARQPEPPPVKAYAQAQNLPVYQPTSLRRSEPQERLTQLHPEAIVVAAYGRFLPEPVLSLPPLGCLNLHPSLLPRHRGPSPVVTAILEGDTITGMSIILLDSGMDTGSLLAQEQEPILPGDTAQSLTERLFRRGAAMLPETLERWAHGQLTPEPQNESRATVTRLVEKEDGWIDWEQPAARLEHQVRAYQPWPGAYTRWRGKLLKLLATRPLPTTEAAGVPGTVVPLSSPQGVAVATGEGLLELRCLQLEGKRALTIAEFLPGYPGFLGSHLPS